MLSIIWSSSSWYNDRIAYILWYNRYEISFLTHNKQIDSTKSLHHCLYGISVSTSITYLSLTSFFSPSLLTLPLLSSSSLLCCDPCCPICLAASLHRCMQLTFALSTLPARSHTHRYYLRKSMCVIVYVHVCIFCMHYSSGLLCGRGCGRRLLTVV